MIKQTLTLIVSILVACGIWQTSVAETTPTVTHQQGDGGVFNSLPAWKKAVYVPAEQWGVEPRYGVVIGGLYPVTEVSKNLIETSPRVKQTTDGLVELLEWFIAGKWHGWQDAYSPLTGNQSQPNHIFCDQAVAMFRTLLQAHGFTSRPVVFEFDDGHGAASHTFLEAWAPDQGKWIALDPHYYTYARSQNAAELVFNRAGLTYLPVPDGDTSQTDTERRTAVDDLFKRGWQLMYMQRPHTGARVEFRVSN